MIPGSWLSNTFRDILTYRAFVSEFNNFLSGLQLHTGYLQNSEFSKWKGTQSWLLFQAGGKSGFGENSLARPLNPQPRDSPTQGFNLKPASLGSVQLYQQRAVWPFN